MTRRRGTLKSTERASAVRRESPLVIPANAGIQPFLHQRGASCTSACRFWGSNHGPEPGLTR